MCDYGDVEADVQASFLEANAWQRESLQLRAQGYDAFLVLVALFFVLLLENTWTFDPSSFKSAAAGEVFLGFLIIGTSAGIFTILTMTLINLKLQRLMARDVADLHVHQVRPSSKSQNLARLDRLAKRWEQMCEMMQWQPASLAYEWYQGSHRAHEEVCGWDLRCPRVQIRAAVGSFVVMVAASLIAIAVRLSDLQGTAWCVVSIIVIGFSAILPVLLFNRSLSDPPGMGSSERNPFGE